MKFIPCLFVFLILVIRLNASNYIAITGATIINSNGDNPLKYSVVLIKDSLIVDVGIKGKVEIPDNSRIINASGKYIIPGLWDSHIHFFQSGGLYTRPDGLDLRERVPYEEIELKWVKANLDDLFRRYMRCGITSVIDMGGPFWNFEVIENSKKAKIAPRAFCSGPLIASYVPEELKTDDPPIIKVKNINEALELVRKEALTGSDFIKVWYVVSKSTSSGLEEFYPILKAVVDESHKLGLKVWVHATELETARKSVEAGADVLVHMITDRKVDDDFIEKAKKNNIMIIPTLWVFDSYAAVYSKQLKLTVQELEYGNPKQIGSLFDMYELDESELGERQKKLIEEKKPIQPSEIVLYNTKKLLDEGILIAAGTDAGNVGVIHGPALYREFEYMKKAGLTNREILTSATINAAKLLDMNDTLGTIENGKVADFLILNSNPLEDINNVADINLIVKNGLLFKPEEILINSPEDIAQKQLNAYNNRNINSFLAVYSKEVEVYEFPDKLLYKGIDKMREVYEPFF